MSFDTDNLSAKLKLGSDTVREAITGTAHADNSILKTNDKPTETESLSLDTTHDEFNISANSFITDKMAKALELYHSRATEGADGIEISFTDGSSGARRVNRKYDPVSPPNRIDAVASIETNRAITEGLEASGFTEPSIDLKSMMQSSSINKKGPSGGQLNNFA